MAKAQAADLLHHLPRLPEHLDGHLHHAVRQEIEPRGALLEEVLPLRCEVEEPLVELLFKGA